MEKSNYTQHMELVKTLNEGKEDVFSWFSELEGVDWIDAKNALEFYSSVQDKYRKFLLEKQRKAWEQYMKEYKAWAKKYKFEPSMEAGMNEPNPPHYTIANNE